MTGSQIRSAIATVVTIIAAIATQLLPLANLLPPTVAHWLPIVIAIAGAIIAAFNQSLSSAHASVPVEKLAALPFETQKKLGVESQL